jgi:hypothetical protein
MTRPRFLVFVFTPLLLVSTARGATYSDCEKFDEPLAYNNCLAEHGPSAARVLSAPGERVLSAPGGKDMPEAQGGHMFRRARGGRMSATFTIEDAHPSPHSGKMRRQ